MFPKVVETLAGGISLHGEREVVFVLGLLEAGTVDFEHGRRNEGLEDKPSAREARVKIVAAYR